MISVIIPTYKGSSKIAVSVYTVLQQDGVEMEIIVVDDNGLGTDEQIKTQHNLQSFIKKGQIIYIPHEQNINGSAARNTGFRASRGEYINFLDDDDIMLGGKLRKQLSILEAADQKVGAVICGTNFVHEDGKGEQVIPRWESGHVQRDYLCERMKFNTSAALFRRSAIEEIDGFDESFRRHQDLEFCIRMMSRYQFLNCEEILLNKYAANRNVASTPDVAVNHYKHFYEKMQPYFMMLPSKDVDMINQYHMCRLLLGYILSFDPLKTINFARRAKIRVIDWIQVIHKLLFLVVRRVFDGKKQIALPWDIYRKEAEIFCNNERYI